ncbi:hypothetical protein [Bradyrhizobium sp. Ai1a-2]|uniref:hypothetical protein n=1 Tax=Bradyrhizobium sp. Ai1a-2 TaxID=196490 RepID=UPI0012684B37|nr:hypothetical protein [Bradyrhizobium sp. Ai1a-2]
MKSGIARSNLSNSEPCVERAAMKENPEKENPERKIPRRDLLRLTIAGSGVAAVGTLVSLQAPAQSVNMKDKRRARYQADSAEVRDFYRVNSYPGAR